LNEVYILKAQLQSLWDKPVSFEQMHANLEAWCELADECGLASIKRVAATLRNPRQVFATTPDTQSPMLVSKKQGMLLLDLSKSVRGASSISY